ISYISFLYSIRTTDTDGFMINESGKQRFLSQTISFLAIQLVSTKNSPEHEKVRERLIITINEMKANHDFLENDKSAILQFYHSPTIDSVYYGPPVFLNKKVHQFIEEAYLLSDGEDRELSYENPHLKYIVSNSATLLNDLNLIVNQYQKENEEEINSIYFNRTYLLLFTLLLYLLIGLFIFNPMTKQIDQNLTRLANKEKEIEQINDTQFAAIIDAQEKERQRIATDLHDGLVQTLTTISYKIKSEIYSNREQESEKNLNEIRALIDESIDETRNIAYSIIPPLLKEFGLIPALNSLCEQFKTHFNINAILQVYELKERLGEKLELTLYRITQEALNNVIKYAKASNVWIQLIRHPASIVLIIEDDGKGFDTTNQPSIKGLGLVNIEERTKAFKGNVSINSSPEQGTEIMVEIPIT
ncbi:MAG: sensor histidine kinase, partial [Bacteroidia bacterium]